MRFIGECSSADRRAPCLPAFLVCLVLAGCGGRDGLDRREVRGSITFDGEPIENGRITLFPLGAGPVASGPIRAGEFRIEESQGPIPGDYKVEITGTRPTGRTLRIENPGGEPRDVPEVVSVVPARYNERTELTLSVGQDKVVVEKRFALTSK